MLDGVPRTYPIFDLGMMHPFVFERKLSSVNNEMCFLRFHVSDGMVFE